MKAVIVLVVIVIAGLLTFNYLSTGELTLLPGKGEDADGASVNRLRGEFRNAAREIQQAGRGAAMGGVDSTSQLEAALATIDRIEEEARSLSEDAAADDARRDAAALVEEIAAYKRKIG